MKLMSAGNPHLDAELMRGGSDSMRQLCKHQAVAGVYVHDAAGPEQVSVVNGLKPHLVCLQIDQMPRQSLQKLIAQLPMTMLHWYTSLSGTLTEDTRAHVCP